MNEEVAKREAQLDRLRKARASRNAKSDKAPSPKRIKFTAKVKRGIAAVRSLVIDSCDDSKPPTSTIIAKWTKKQTHEFNAAMEWLEQVERDIEGATP